MLRKIKFLAILILFIAQAFVISAQQSYNDISLSGKTLIFSESFDNNSNSWLLDNSWIKGNVDNGYYNIVCKNYQKSTGLSYKTIPIDKAKDYELETSFKVVKGTCALIFGMTNKFDHYRIEIADNNLYIVKDVLSEKKLEKIFSGSVKSSIKPGSFNKITIRRLNGIFFVYLNESFIGKFSNIKPEGDQIGFSTNLHSEISVDYLNINYLANQTAPLLADRNITKKDTVKIPSEKVAIAVPEKKDSSNSSVNNSLVAARISSSPLVTWVSPSGLTTSLDTYTARVRANIKSATELKSVLFYVNGASRGEGEIKLSAGEKVTYQAEKIISLNPGENNVYLIATNSEGSSKSDLRYFSNPQTDPPEIKWGIPVMSNAIVNTETLGIEVCIKSPADLMSAKVLVDGVQVTVSKIFQRSDGSNCNYTWKPQIILKEGDNSIYVIAENIAGSTTSENRLIKFSRALTEKRIALVIGNSEYVNGSTLKNPVNDANLMEATLKNLGFDVIKQLNAGKESMISSIREFSRKLSDYNVALFYYAGHGIQVEGVNYLIPTNAKLDNKDDCKWEAITVNTVTDEFKKNTASTNIVILDACRNNPYRSWARGGEVGFKALAPINGTIVSFSTSEGSTAADGDGANGLFTEELVKQMVIPQQIESVFKKTRKEVVERSKGMQTPTEWSYLMGDFYFKK